MSRFGLTCIFLLVKFKLDIRKDKCLKDWRDKPLMRLLIGIDELVMSSVKQLSENQTERGSFFLFC